MKCRDQQEKNGNEQYPTLIKSWHCILYN